MKGFKFMLQAAEAGDRLSMITVARAFDTGIGLSADRLVKLVIILPPRGNFRKNHKRKLLSVLFVILKVIVLFV